MRIGYVVNLYPEKRCVIDKVGKDFAEYIDLKRKYYDLRFVVRKLICKLSGQASGWNTNYYYAPVVEPNVDLVHTFNHVCKIHGKWVVTIEGIEPRTKETTTGNWSHVKNGEYKLDRFTIHNLKLLEKDNCRALIALSDSTAALEREFLNSINPKYKIDIKRISDKIIVLHPPQNLMADEKAVRVKCDAVHKGIRLLFVGHDFWCKGGAQLLDVLAEFHNRGELFQIDIVSSLKYGDAYASGSTRKDYVQYKKMIEEANWINWYEKLPNSEVINLAKKAHIGCLPTLSDTYGYSVLEMQACGCPVITTNIRSLPEINNDECGWICHIPKRENAGGGAYLRTAEEKRKCKEILSKELRRCFDEIFACPELIETKALASIKRIKEKHDPNLYSNRLLEIYSKV